ncbi:YncE family protein [Nocardia sp. NPDC051030]|uniref:YncE family protein n=1 Tax=Nocardia sp. NPDC051030 TaxID=3155162 RepID=UPI003413370B
MSQPVAALRLARVYDGRDEVGRPTVNRYPVDSGLRDALLAYLESAPVVFAARSLDVDEFAPSDSDVPLNYRTDGVWVWAGSVPHYLRKHGLPPEPELVQHIMNRGFQVGVVDDSRRELAIAALGKPHMEALTPVRQAPLSTPPPTLLPPALSPPPVKNGRRQTILIAAICGIVAALVSGFATVAVFKQDSAPAASAEAQTTTPTANSTVPAVSGTVPLGTHPEDIAIEGKTAYIADTLDNTVWMIDTTTMTTKGLLPISNSVTSVAANAKAGAVYVSTTDGHGQGWINVIATRKYGSPKVDAVIPIGRHAKRIAVDQDANRAYVTIGYDDDNYGIAIIDTSSNTLIGTVEHDVMGGRPMDVAVNPFTHTVYASVWDRKGSGSSLVALDPNTRTVMATVHFEARALRLAVDSNGGLVHVLFSDYTSPTKSITSVSMTTNTIARSVDIGKSVVESLAVDPDNHVLYFGTLESPRGISVLDTATNTVTTTVGRGNSSYMWSSPGSVAVDPQTHAVYGTDQAAPGKLVVLKR